MSVPVVFAVVVFFVCWALALWAAWKLGEQSGRLAAMREEGRFLRAAVQRESALRERIVDEIEEWRGLRLGSVDRGDAAEIETADTVLGVLADVLRDAARAEGEEKA